MIRDCTATIPSASIARDSTLPATARKAAGRGGKITNLTTSVHGLLRVKAKIRDKSYPFMIDTGAKVSLIPFNVVEDNHLQTKSCVARQPLMVDGTTLRCEGLTSTNLCLGSRSVYCNFYVVKDMNVVFWERIFCQQWRQRLMLPARNYSWEMRRFQRMSR